MLEMVVTRFGKPSAQFRWQEAHPWEHELAHDAHEQVEHPQDAHFAAHAQVPDAQPQLSEQEQAIVRGKYGDECVR